MADGHNSLNFSLRKTANVLGADIDVVDFDDALARVADWASRYESRYVCICNVHSVVTTSKDADFSNAVKQASMATPDGAPVAWFMRRLGFRKQVRVNGPDLMWRYFAEAAKRNESIFLYGGTPETLSLLKERIEVAFPNLLVAGCHSPPFRTLTPEEDLDIVNTINSSGAGTVWVSLGCPKQEKWMAAHRGRVNAVMLGVGAAFDYHAGTIKRAPIWMQSSGLEWLHRFCSEPRRLFKRYVYTNTFFIIGAARQLLFPK